MARWKVALQQTSRTLRLGMVLPLRPTMRLYKGTDKDSLHKYGTSYERHFRQRRWRPNRVLEIGVGGYEIRDEIGGSLRIWRDYFPRSTVVGLDLYDKDVSLGDRVGFVQGDQTSQGDLARAVDRLGGPPDIVIDDGSHLVNHAESSFRYLFPLMKSGSLYVIEDLHSSYWSDYGGAVPAPPGTAVALTKMLVDAVQAGAPVFQSSDHPTDSPPVDTPGVGSVHVYPGIVFIEKV